MNGWMEIKCWRTSVGEREGERVWVEGGRAGLCSVCCLGGVEEGWMDCNWGEYFDRLRRERGGEGGGKKKDKEGKRGGRGRGRGGEGRWERRGEGEERGR